MSKMLFNNPVINPFDLEDDDDPIVIGGGSGEGTVFPVSLNVWLETYTDLNKFDYDGNGVLNQADYYSWWQAHNFTSEQWASANPGLPFGPGNNP